MHAGLNNDAGLITSLTYPWNTRQPGYSLEDHGDSISAPSSDANMPLLRTPYVSLAPEGPQVHAVGHLQNNIESYGTLPEQQVPPPLSANSIPQASDSGYQSASLEDFLMNSNEGGLLDAGWWNSARTMNAWDHPLSMAEIPRNPMP